MFGKLYHFLCIFNHQWWSIEKLNRHQSTNLRKTVKLAYKNVPFYENLYNRSNIKPDIINSIQDIQQLPIINRKMVKDAGINIISKQYNISKLNSEKTSGSTGRPLTIYRSHTTHNLIKVSKLRSYLATGYNPFCITAAWKTTRPKKRLHNLLGIYRELTVLRNVPVKEQIKVLAKTQPAFYDVNISQLNEVMQYLEKNLISVTLRPKRIFHNSENLIPSMRKKVEQYFGTNPYDTYGTREFGFIAWECNKREGYHINADLLFVEILDPETWTNVGEGESGRVVITDLWNPAFPLIRYDTGDFAVYTEKTCSCGRVFPLIKAINGRDADLLTLPSGNQVSGPLLVTFELRKHMQIEQYQAVYTRDNELVLKLKMRKGKLINEDKIIANIQKHCENIPIRIKYVDGFEKSESGKFRTFISEIS